MVIDENKYNSLFISKFKANASELISEYKRIMLQHGETEEIKFNFYAATFKQLIQQFKREVPKDKNYGYVITCFYKYFIDLLKEDGIDATKFENELLHFQKNELPKIVIEKSEFIPESKVYNLNSKYGRRKAREQAARNYDNGTPEYRSEIDSLRTIVWIIIFVIAIVVFIFKNGLF